MMKKKVIVMLCMAALLLATATACKDTGKDPKDSTTDTSSVSGTSTGEPGTDPAYTTATPETREPVTTQPPVEETFKDVSLELYILTTRATVRTEPVVNDKTGYSWPSEGVVLKATGESANWYRISYDGKDCYISKSVVCDNALLKGFSEVNETVEITMNVNVRSVPSSANDNSKRGVLTKGTKVTRVGVGNGWSCILYDVVYEKETDTEGKPRTETKRYYISSDCVSSSTATTEPGTTTASH